MLAQQDLPVLQPLARTAPPRTALRAVLVTARPRQWLKNLLVIAAAAAAGALGHDDVLGRVLLVCMAFCMVASGTYAINDARDRDEDRAHPRKCTRPVAAGQISPGVAVTAGVASIVAGLALGFAVDALAGITLLAYVALTVTYTLVWRHVFLLDIIAIAGGFVLRAVAGGVAASVPLSHWFVLVVTFAALMVAAGKRRSELRRLDGALLDGRRVMRHYSLGTVNLILVVCASGLLGAYALWAFEVPVVDGVPWRLLTIVPLIVAVGRYGWLLRKGQGEAPDELVLRDLPLATASLCWLTLFALGVHAVG